MKFVKWLKNLVGLNKNHQKNVDTNNSPTNSNKPQENSQLITRQHSFSSIAGQLSVDPNSSITQNSNRQPSIAESTDSDGSSPAQSRASTPVSTPKAAVPAKNLLKAVEPLNFPLARPVVPDHSNTHGNRRKNSMWYSENNMPTTTSVNLGERTQKFEESIWRGKKHSVHM